MQNIKTCFQKYFVFSDRASRSEYWSFFFFTLITTIILGGISLYNSYFISIANIFGIITFIPGITVMVRRLHDTNRSGWWFFINLIPIIGNIAFIVFLLQKSHPSKNQWNN
ncbi:DUF805 domain-containing protein [bacterium]|jgi:uncharacterized membrane protein YhaH (DUF805 family)|nr:DUF805 domain-containing protein [bacterium]MBT6293781.1 DUF805 domain-containing protein [bacterium]